MAFARHSAFAILLSLFLGEWSSEAALLRHGASRHHSASRAAASDDYDGDSYDDEDMRYEEEEDDREDDREDESPDNRRVEEREDDDDEAEDEDDEATSGPKSSSVALPQVERPLGRHKVHKVAPAAPTALAAAEPPQFKTKTRKPAKKAIQAQSPAAPAPAVAAAPYSAPLSINATTASNRTTKVLVTTLTNGVSAGAKTLNVQSMDGFMVGAKVVIDKGLPVEEVRTIAAFGSIILDAPLAFAHDAGATITMQPLPKKLSCSSKKTDAAKEVCVLEEALAANQEKQTKLSQSLQQFSDEDRAAAAIDDKAKGVAKETESKALASTLASMWKEMRMFDLPFYAEHVEEELHLLRREETQLKAKLAAAKDKKTKEAAETKKEKKEKAEQHSPIKHLHSHIDHIETGNADVDKTASQANDALTSNFWAMNATQKEEFLIGTLVYIICGLLFAFLFYKARQNYPKYFEADALPDMARNTSDFSFSLFGCFGAPANICIMGFCCPLMTWASTLERIGLMKFFQAFLIMLVLIALHSYTFGCSTIAALALGVYYRQKLRKTYQIENGTPRTVCCDVLAWAFCTTCAICQEAREDGVGSQIVDAP